MDTSNSSLIGSLDSLADEELHTVIDHAKALLLARVNERRRQAALEIRRLAKEHGLDVAVKQPGRKRGRPRKSD